MGIDGDSAKLAFAHLVSAFFVFLAISLFSRELGAYQMGIFFLFQTSLGLLSLVVDFGLNQSVNKHISEGKAPDAIISSGLIIKGVLFSLISILIILFSESIDSYIGGSYSLSLILGLVLYQGSRFIMAVLRGSQRVGETAVPKAVKQIAFFATGWVFIYFGFKAEGVVYALLLGMGFMLFLGLVRVNIKPSIPNLNNIKSVADYSRYAAIFSVGGLVNNWMDVAIIGLFMSKDLVGIYETSWRVAGLLSLISVAIGMTIFPKLSKWHSSNKNKLIEAQLPKSAGRALFFVIPALFAFTVISEDILTILFGEEFGAGWLVLIILGGQQMIDSLQNVYGRSLQASSSPNKAARASIASVVSNVVLNIVLVSEFGIVGAAVATLTATIVNLLINILYLRQLINVRFPKTLALHVALSAAGMTFIIILLDRMININSIIKLFGVVIAGGVSYLLFALLSSSLREMITEVLNDVGATSA